MASHGSHLSLGNRRNPRRRDAAEREEEDDTTVELQVETLTTCSMRVFLYSWYAILVAALVVQSIVGLQWQARDLCTGQPVSLYDFSSWNSAACARRQSHWVPVDWEEAAVHEAYTPPVDQRRARLLPGHVFWDEAAFAAALAIPRVEEDDDKAGWASPGNASASLSSTSSTPRSTRHPKPTIAPYKKVYHLQWNASSFSALLDRRFNRFMRAALSLASPMERITPAEALHQTYPVVVALEQTAFAPDAEEPSEDSGKGSADGYQRCFGESCFSTGSSSSSSTAASSESSFPRGLKYSFNTTVTCRRDTARCNTLVLPPTVAVSSTNASRFTVTLLGVNAELGETSFGAAVGFVYQRAPYTMATLIWRYAALGSSLLILLRFLHRSQQQRRMAYEQYWVLALQLGFILFVDPLFALGVLRPPAEETPSPSPPPRWWSSPRLTSVTHFMEFHVPNYFAALCVSFGFAVIAASFNWGDHPHRRSDVHRRPGSSSSGGHGSPPRRVTAALLGYIALIVGLDVTMVFLEHWRWGTEATCTAPACRVVRYLMEGCLAGGVLVSCVVLLWLRRSLAKHSYLETRPQQLACRVFIFVFFTAWIYIAAQTLLVRLLYPQIIDIVLYQPMIQLSPLMVATVFVHHMSTVYTSRQASRQVPPRPGHQRGAWKRMVWSPRWFRWLQWHGGSQYIFLTEAEERLFNAIQSHGRVPSFLKSTTQRPPSEGEEGEVVGGEAITAVPCSPSRRHLLSSQLPPSRSVPSFPLTHCTHGGEPASSQRGGSGAPAGRRGHTGCDPDLLEIGDRARGLEAPMTGARSSPTDPSATAADVGCRDSPRPRRAWSSPPTPRGHGGARASTVNPLSRFSTGARTAGADRLSSWPSSFTSAASSHCSDASAAHADSLGDDHNADDPFSPQEEEEEQEEEVTAPLLTRREQAAAAEGRSGDVEVGVRIVDADRTRGEPQGSREQSSPSSPPLLLRGPLRVLGALRSAERTVVGHTGQILDLVEDHVIDTSLQALTFAGRLGVPADRRAASASEAAGGAQYPPPSSNHRQRESQQQMRRRRLQRRGRFFFNLETAIDCFNMAWEAYAVKESRGDVAISTGIDVEVETVPGCLAKVLYLFFSHIFARRRGTILRPSEGLGVRPDLSSDVAAGCAEGHVPSPEHTDAETVAAGGEQGSPSALHTGRRLPPPPRSVDLGKTPSPTSRPYYSRRLSFSPLTVEQDRRDALLLATSFPGATAAATGARLRGTPPILTEPPQLASTAISSPSSGSASTTAPASPVRFLSNPLTEAAVGREPEVPEGTAASVASSASSLSPSHTAGHAPPPPPPAPAPTMHPERFGYERIAVFESHGVQVVITRLDCTHPFHRGKFPRLVVAFRGTDNATNAMQDIRFRKRSWKEMERGVLSRRALIHSGFLESWMALKEQALSTVFTELRRRFADHNEDSGSAEQRPPEPPRADGLTAWRLPPVEATPLSLSYREAPLQPSEGTCRDEPQRIPNAESERAAFERALHPVEAFYDTVYITGHSLGGALACLCAYSLHRLLLLTRYPNPDPTVYTFGQPRIGNRAFQRLYNHAIPKTFRVVNESDAVSGFNLFGGHHVGSEVDMDRNGNFICCPMSVEQFFRPTRGRSLQGVASHTMTAYAASLNAIADRHLPSHPSDSSSPARPTSSLPPHHGGGCRVRCLESYV